MRAHRYLAIGLMLVSSLAAGVPVHIHAATGSQSLAGHWVFQGMWVDDPSLTLGDWRWGLTDANFRTTLPTQKVTTAITMDIVSDASGQRVTFKAEETFVADSSGVSPQCNARLFTSKLLQGTCHVTTHGTGHFDQSNAVPEFILAEEWMTFYGAKTVREVHNPFRPDWAGGPYPIDYWAIEAQPGYYKDEMPNYGSMAPPDFSGSFVVSRY